MDFEAFFSKTARRLKPSIIRKLLALVQKGNVISFAGGTPDARLFPKEILSRLAEKVIAEQGELALQYGETAGWMPLRQEVASWLGAKGIKCSPENILITNGSQQGIDLLGRVLLDGGDAVAVENPSYLGGLFVFKNFDASYITLPCGRDGLDIEGTAAAFDAAPVKPKFVYLVPTFQNPSGYTMTPHQREALVKMAVERNLVIVEDDPYGELSYEADSPRPLKSYDEDGRVVYLGSFSKIGVPGFRLGWTCADETLIAKMVMAKETADVCSNVYSQAIAAEYFRQGHLKNQLRLLKDTYRSRRDAMIKALEEELPASVTFNRPAGGFFVWLEGSQGLDATALFEKAVQAGVAYVPGAAFFANEGEGKNTLRLTFCTCDEVTIADGIRRLAKVLRDEIEKGREHKAEDRFVLSPPPSALSGTIEEKL